jgi:hypothetical protein
VREYAAEIRECTSSPRPHAHSSRNPSPLHNGPSIGLRAQRSAPVALSMRERPHPSACAPSRHWFYRRATLSASAPSMRGFCVPALLRLHSGRCRGRAWGRQQPVGEFYRAAAATLRIKTPTDKWNASGLSIFTNIDDPKPRSKLDQTCSLLNCVRLLLQVDRLTLHRDGHFVTRRRHSL